MKKKSVILTFDIDWAPDFIIKDIAEVLIKKNIPSVWFVTHESEILNFSDLILTCLNWGYIQISHQTQLKEITLMR